MPDRISTLPDGVLCYILSFLPTEDAVATSVLSKRWTNLWRSVPALDFTYFSHKQTSSNFDGIVYSVMLFRDAVTPIQRFSLNIKSNYYDFCNINNWVKFVLQRRVEHLNLDLTREYEMPNLPINIFTCRTLVVLKLYGFSFAGFSSVTLPSAKALRLENIRFPEYRYIMEILAGCPILEDLALYSITIDSDDPSSSYGEFKSLRLTKLTVAGIDSDIHIPLRVLYNVEKLIIEINELNHSFSFDEISTFHNLTNLELNFIKYNWNLIVEMLKHCPKLRNLVLEETNMDEGVHRRKGEERKGGQENWVDPDFVPECFSLHLRTCTLRNYEGLQGELLFARYIIKNAEVLQSMTVYTTRYSCKNKRRYEMMKRKLSWCPRSSAICEVDFQFFYNE